ncbi:hypothetical protein SAMN05216241_10148 [Limimonas halophila]|uniref:LexA-binding, inner membrane-associated hydrolase n=1 Tax=Limimonas halophila TaxID=1082479 RepID=A0A1G7KYI6_9PROT|nr:hypothetical protein [Limimonas halophila]SDF42317.1 hypothetical protein SAMN05216241_10148 [Limimonas halophila]
MNTPTHLLVGLAVAGRVRDDGRNLGALAGAFAPDAALFVLFGWAKLVQGVPDGVIFDELYWTPGWQIPLAVSNSVVVWGALGLLALWLRRGWLIAFVLAGLVHLGCDFALHHGDAYPHLWPLSDWRFQSPVSYWNPAHHGEIVQPLELALAFGLAVWLARRHQQPWLRTGLAMAVVAFGAGLGYWAWVF